MLLQAVPSQVTVILKQKGDTMAATLADITGTEKASVESFNQLSKAKTAEIDVCTASIDDKMKRIGDLGVKFVPMKSQCWAFTWRMKTLSRVAAECLVFL